jgi:hypothetical protein
MQTTGSVESKVSASLFDAGGRDACERFRRGETSFMFSEV